MFVVIVYIYNNKFIIFLNITSRNISVGIASNVDLGSIPGRVKRFSFSMANRPVVESNPSIIQWVLWFLFPGVNLPDCEADH
jgi:hypothetical protein